MIVPELLDRDVERNGSRELVPMGNKSGARHVPMRPLALSKQATVSIVVSTLAISICCFFARTRNALHQTVLARDAARPPSLQGMGRQIAAKVASMKTCAIVLSYHNCTYLYPADGSASIMRLDVRRWGGRWLHRLPGCLDGQITDSVSSPVCKNIPVHFSPKSPAYHSPSRPTQRGVSRSSRTLGAGCDGREVR